jgi:hypothetical protein
MSSKNNMFYLSRDIKSSWNFTDKGFMFAMNTVSVVIIRRTTASVKDDTKKQFTF